MDHKTHCLNRAASYLELLLTSAGYQVLVPKHLDEIVLVAGRADAGFILHFGLEQAKAEFPTLEELAFLGLPCHKVWVAFQKEDASGLNVLQVTTAPAVIEVLPARKKREFGIELAPWTDD